MNTFLEATGPHRKRGFDHFLYSLGSFASNVLLIAYLKLPPRLGYPTLLLVSGWLVTVGGHWREKAMDSCGYGFGVGGWYEGEVKPS